MTVRLIFSKSARRDRQSITAYTIKHYGTDQTRQMRQKFQTVLTSIADNPNMGKQRPELDPTGISFRYFVAMKRFVIVYRPTESGIEVARIIHTSRDLAAQLEPDVSNKRDHDL